MVRFDRKPGVAVPSEAADSGDDAQTSRHSISWHWPGELSPFSFRNPTRSDDLIRFSINAARKAVYLHSGQHVVITGGVPLHVAGNTNFIKVEKVVVL